jgi:hypothetical protein
MPIVHRRFGRFLVALVVAGLLASGCGRARIELDSLPLDLTGSPVDPFAVEETTVTAFLFIGTECPISNRFAPEIRRVGDAFDEENVVFWFVYPDPAETPESVRQHLAEYGHQTQQVLLDPEHALAQAVGVTRTPEVAVYDADWNRVYRGRINNRFVDFGRTRPAATTHEFESAIAATLEGRTVSVPETEAIGCFIADSK